jgi:hypothetical protein
MTSVEGCRFCAIIAGDERAHVVFEDDISIAFLDHRPLFPGHALLAPREHFETIWDLPDELVGPLFTNAKSVSKAIRTAMASQGAFIALNNVVSQSVPPPARPPGPAESQGRPARILLAAPKVRLRGTHARDGSANPGGSRRRAMRAAVPAGIGGSTQSRPTCRALIALM